MKKVFLFIVSCLLLGTTTASAANELVIHLLTGTTQRFVLINENPTISFSGENIVVQTSTTTVTYAMEDVSYFNYEDNGMPTGIGGASVTDGMKIDGDRILFSGLPVGSKVFVYTTAGKVCMSETVGADGTASLNINSLSRGVYIVNADNISTKITKK